MPFLKDMGRLISKRRRDDDGLDGLLQDEELAAAVIETKPISTTRERQDDVHSLIRKIGVHLDNQAGRTQTLIGFVERLPNSLEALPEMNRQNTRLLDVLTDHLDQVRSREDALNSTLSRLGDATIQQTRALTQVQEALDRSSTLSVKASDTLGSFHQNLTQLTETNTRSVEVLSTIAETMDQHERRLTGLLDRSHRWLVAALVTSSIVGLAAIVLAFFALSGG